MVYDIFSKIRSRRDQESANLEDKRKIAMQRSARKVRPVGPCPEGTNVDIFFETLVIDTGKAREPYVSASRGSYEANNTLTVYTPPPERDVRLVGSHD